MSQAGSGAEGLGGAREDVLTKGTPVSQARGIVETPCLVRQEADLRDVAEELSRHRQVHTAAVVDAQGALVGIIPLRLLVDELFLRVSPEEFIADILDQRRMAEYGKMVHARTAAELMLRPVAVTDDDTIGQAFARMHEHDLEGLPIVDAAGRPVGYLDRLELIRVWLRQHPTGSGAGS